MVRTRIAPSPTGYPHIGTIYQALFNYAYAKRNNGQFLVRIEDTDRARFVEGAEAVIFSALDWFGLTEDESPRKEGEHKPYRQSERLELYHKYAQELLDKDLAYYAYYPKKDAGVKKDYSQKQATTDAEPGETPPPPKSIQEMIEKGDWVIRMRVPKDKPITFQDVVRGDITFQPDQVTEQVLIKSDGFPTYHLAVVVDDHLMGVNYVVRGEEWISSTPKHVLLYDYFGWEKPVFCHTADLRNPDKSKLSKRHGHTNVNWYREEGYLPEALLNFLALQGWTHPEEKEIFSLAEFVSVFDLNDLRAVGPIFDLTKLTWMNGEYIRMKSDDELKKLILDFSPEAKKLDEKTLDILLPLLKSRMATLKDFAELTSFFIQEPEGLSYSDTEKEVAKELLETMPKIADWNKTTIFDTIKPLLTKYKVRMPVFYRLFTGKERGLPLPEALEIYGKEKAISRLKAIE